MKYTNILVMTILSFISMYILMYIMVDKFVNVYANLNQFYMAGIMTMPMILIELFVMKDMYKNNFANIAISTSSLILLALLIYAIRNQTAISDREFLKSMIPHHASAILMSTKAKLKDQELVKLAKNIITSQQSEIDFMKQKLKELKIKD